MTNTKVDYSKPYVLLLPMLGMGLFVILYIIAALNYPGGSWAFRDQNGFSFWNNYLCDLLDQYAINGEINTARFYARALGLLCASIILLWYYLPKLFVNKSLNLRVMQLSGFLALLVTFFLASGTHDIIVRIAGVFGIIALISMVIELYKIRYYKLHFFGLFCLIVFFINYYIYETGVLIKVLPVIQKFTFVCFIAWFILLDTSLYRKLKFMNTKKNL